MNGGTGRQRKWLLNRLGFPKFIGFYAKIPLVGYNKLVKRVSIIIVHYNNAKVTNACLHSLDKLVVPRYQLTVLVVDNGSLKSYRLPVDLRKNGNITCFVLTQTWVLLVATTWGFTRGRAAQCAIHFLLNNDTTIEKMFYVTCCTFWKNPDAGLVCPKIYFTAGKEFHQKSYTRDQRGSVIWFAGGTMDWRHLTAFHRGVDEVDRGQFDHLSQTDFATGCAMLIKREVLEKIGFLDKRYFMYFEDVDLSLRAVSAGYSILFCPSAVVWHDNAGSSGGSGSDLHVYYQERNRYLFAILHNPVASLISIARLQLQALLSGNRYRRKAVVDLYRRSFGKHHSYEKATSISDYFGQKWGNNVARLPAYIAVVQWGPYYWWRFHWWHCVRSWGCGSSSYFLQNTNRLPENAKRGAKHAASPWLLYIDSDERVTPELVAEISAALHENSRSLRTASIEKIYFWQAMHHGGWETDVVTRLIKKDQLSGWKGEIHESPKISGEIGQLQEPLVHFSHRSVSDGLLKSADWTKQRPCYYQNYR